MNIEEDISNGEEILISVREYNGAALKREKIFKVRTSSVLGRVYKEYELLCRRSSRRKFRRKNRSMGRGNRRMNKKKVQEKNRKERYDFYKDGTLLGYRETIFDAGLKHGDAIIAYKAAAFQI